MSRSESLDFRHEETSNLPIQLAGKQGLDPGASRLFCGGHRRRSCRRRLTMLFQKLGKQTAIDRRGARRVSRLLGPVGNGEMIQEFLRRQTFIAVLFKLLQKLCIGNDRFCTVLDAEKTKELISIADRHEVKKCQ